MGFKTIFLAFLLSCAFPPGFSSGQEAGEPPAAKEEKAENPGMSAKLDALGKLLDEPGSVRVVQALLELPENASWKVSEGTAKAVDGSAPDVRFAEDLEKIDFHDETAAAFKSANLKKAFEDMVAKERGKPPGFPPWKMPDPLKMPALIEWKAGESRILCISDGIGLAAYSIGKEGSPLIWARRIVYDSELLEYNDRSDVQFRVTGTRCHYREKPDGSGKEPIREKPSEIGELQGFSVATRVMEGSQRLILTVAKGTLCAYEFDDDSVEFFSSRRVIYEFEMPTYPSDEACRMKDIVSRVMAGKDLIAGKDRWIALIGKGNTVYAILNVKGRHCFYEIKAPPAPANFRDKGIAFMGAWRRE